MSHDTHAPLAIHPVEVDDPHTLVQRRQVQRGARWLVLISLLLLGLGAGRTVYSRIENAKALDAAVAEKSALYVRATQVRAAGSAQNLALPGTLQGYVQSPVAARAGGYLKRWTRDIGSRVAKGELLAEIETPELDQQLSQAMAAQQQTAASLELARSTMERWEALRQRDAVSQQELEERRSAHTQAKANLAAADANVERLRQLESFKRVVAPFAGLITRRNVDIGDLIDGSGRPLFLLAQTDPLRVYVSVPQAYAHLIKPGQPATVVQADMGSERFTGQVARTSGAIDPVTRTLQTEIALPNRDGKLLPGSFVQVSLSVGGSGALSVAANALLFRGSGTFVGIIDAGSKVKLQKVRLGRNYGETVEVLEGLGGSERLVLNPPDSLAEGDRVQVVADAPKTGKATP